MRLLQAGGSAGLRQARLVAGERPPAGGHLEQQHAQAVDVGARVHRAAFDLFRAHVRGRAHGRGGQRRAFHCPRDAEVGEQHLAVPLQHHVARLQVTVYEPVDVRVVQRAAQVAQDGRQLLDLKQPAALLQAPAQRRAIDVVHDDERHQAVLLEGVETDDVGVV